MKQLTLFICIIMSLATYAQAPTLVPSVTSEFCPGIAHIISFVRAGQFGGTSLSVTGQATVGTVTQSYDFNTGITSFSFPMTFNDFPQRVSLIITLRPNGATAQPYTYNFDRISLLQQIEFQVT